MNLKNLFITSVATLGLACTGTADSPVNVLNAVAFDDSCSPDKSLYTPWGELNLDLVNTLGYGSATWVFYWESNLQPISTNVGGDVVSGADMNDFIAERVEVTYTLEPAVNGVSELAAQSTSQYSVLRPGAKEEGQVAIPLIPPQTMQELQSLGIAGTGATLKATFTVHGRLRGGREIASNPVTFPINVFSTPAPTCGTGEVLDVVGCGAPLNSAYACVTP
ncbi:MAG: hypothetical protein L0Y64_05480 [Myxococcaceae bacterium]|nr:hypothetical protein [Myxococcaceae bacterium]